MWRRNRPGTRTACRKTFTAIRQIYCLQSNQLDTTARVAAAHSGAYVAQQQLRRTRQQAADACAQDWNAVHDAPGSFADEHSTL